MLRCTAVLSTPNGLTDIGGHRHRSQCRRYPTSDIDICYSDIVSVPISTSEFIPISNIDEKKYSPRGFEPTPHKRINERHNTKLLSLSVYIGMSYIGYWIKLYSDIRYNVGLRSLSPISEVPIAGSVRYR